MRSRLVVEDRVGSTPAASQPTQTLVKPWVVEYLGIQGNGAGGALGVVLNDGIIDRRTICETMVRAHSRGDWRAFLIGEVLLLMSRRQRAKLVRWAWNLD